MNPARCESIGHSFRDGVCIDCGAMLCEWQMIVGQPVYDPRRLPVGAVISSSDCGPVTVLGLREDSQGKYLLTTECEHGEKQIRLEAAAWRCGGVKLEALP